MFFIHLARIAAILMFGLGILQILLGIGIAADIIAPYQRALSQYTTITSSQGLISQGTVRILIAIALGTVAEIGFLVRKRKAPDQEPNHYDF